MRKIRQTLLALPFSFGPRVDADVGASESCGIDWMSTLYGPASSWFWIMLQAVVVSITLVLIYLQLRTQRHSNMIATLERMEERWLRPECIRARHGICSNYLQPAAKDRNNITHRESLVLDFFEDLGLLLRYRVLNIDAIWEGYSYVIEHYWKMMEPRIIEFRTSTNDLTWYTDFEYLQKKSKQRTKKKKASSREESQEGMEKFAHAEIARLKDAESAATPGDAKGTDE